MQAGLALGELLGSSSSLVSTIAGGSIQPSATSAYRVGGIIPEWAVDTLRWLLLPFLREAAVLLTTMEVLSDERIDDLIDNVHQLQLRYNSERQHASSSSMDSPASPVPDLIGWGGNGVMDTQAVRQEFAFLAACLQVELDWNPAYSPSVHGQSAPRVTLAAQDWFSTALANPPPPVFSELLRSWYGLQF